MTAHEMLTRVSATISRLETTNAELLEMMERAVKISLEHPDFKLWAMEPFTAAIAKAKGEING